MTPPIIDARTIHHYIETKARIDDLTREVAMLREDLIEKLREGAECDPASPWALFIQETSRAAVDWKDVAIDWMKRSIGDRWAKEVSKLEARHRTLVTTLQKRPNTAYLKISEV